MKDRINHLLAALTLFTRLPWWRIKEIPAEAFKHAVDFWPWAGLLTGGSMALTFYIGIQFLPLPLTLLLCIGVRLLLTGALHEDGLADFFDGMGGGTTRERTLEIMKDSHIGTYGVLGLVLYFLFLYNTCNELTLSYLRESLTLEAAGRNPILMMATTMWFADVWAKSVASFIIVLPYARNEEEAKVKVVYQRPGFTEWFTHLLRIVLALALPFTLMIHAGISPNPMALLTSVLVFLALILYLKRRINGYTGDCCGATFLCCEMAYLMAQLLAYTAD